MGAPSTPLTLRAGADAFGDGNHPSTQGALLALEALSGIMGVRNALDIGCGSGILALSIAYRWHIPVIASDISPQAVAATRSNAEQNGLAPLITALRADGYDHAIIRAHAPYDLIVCNWLAEQLCAHASSAAAHAADEGLLVASGILHAHAQRVTEHLGVCGFVLLQKITVGDWVTLLVQKQERV